MGEDRPPVRKSTSRSWGAEDAPMPQPKPARSVSARPPPTALKERDRAAPGAPESWPETVVHHIEEAAPQGGDAQREPDVTDGPRAVTAERSSTNLVSLRSPRHEASTALVRRDVEHTTRFADRDPATLDPRLALLVAPDSQRAATFRLLRDTLSARKAPRIIAISSGAAHEGKTTCAVNLALAFAESPSTRVLLVDANFFAPTLGGIFFIDAQTPTAVGLDQPWLLPYRVCDVTPSLHVAALVREPGAAPPAFNRRWFDMAIGHLSAAAYDQIIIDAAALDGMATVTQIVGAAHGTLLTARSGTTTARSLRRAAALLPKEHGLGVTLMDDDSPST